MQKAKVSRLKGAKSQDGLGQIHTSARAKTAKPVRSPGRHQTDFSVPIPAQIEAAWKSRKPIRNIERAVAPSGRQTFRFFLANLMPVAFQKWSTQTGKPWHLKDPREAWSRESEFRAPPWYSGLAARRGAGNPAGRVQPGLRNRFPESKPSRLQKQPVSGRSVGVFAGKLKKLRRISADLLCT